MICSIAEFFADSMPNFNFAIWKKACTDTKLAYPLLLSILSFYLSSPSIYPLLLSILSVYPPSPLNSLPHSTRSRSNPSRLKPNLRLKSRNRLQADGSWGRFEGALRRIHPNFGETSPLRRWAIRNEWSFTRTGLQADLAREASEFDDPGVDGTHSRVWFRCWCSRRGALASCWYPSQVSWLNFPITERSLLTQPIPLVDTVKSTKEKEEKVQQPQSSSFLLRKTDSEECSQALVPVYWWRQDWYRLSSSSTESSRTPSEPTKESKFTKIRTVVYPYPISTRSSSSHCRLNLYRSVSSSFLCNIARIRTFGSQSCETPNVSQNLEEFGSASMSQK